MAAYRCKYCGSSEHLKLTDVGQWTVWFRCVNCLILFGAGDQSHNRNDVQQTPLKRK